MRRAALRRRFLWQRFIAGGTLQLDPTAVFECPVVFKGGGSVIIEANVRFGYSEATATAQPIMLQPRSPGSVIRIGECTQIMSSVEIIAVDSVTIGKRCPIGPRTIIMDSDFHGTRPDARAEPGVTRPVAIEDNVWIGSDATILKGVTIGRDAVIGTRCVVTKDVAAGAIVVGNPMRVIGSAYDR
jgi:acetyltransferase-like isoleucine patch superfamily enzyme